jgi:WD40 repeat protein
MDACVCVPRTCVQLPTIDSARTVATGPGCTSFLPGDAGRTHNVLHLTPVNTAGAVVIVASHDVTMSLRNTRGDGEVGAATVTVAASGQLTVTYTITDADTDEIAITASVRGLLLWTGTPRRLSTVTGRYTRSLAVESSSSKYGLLVTPDGRYMGVLYYSLGRLLVYRLNAYGTATRLHRLTGGSGPKQFDNPFKMCFTPTGNILVCDESNNRIQELTGLGEAEPEFMRAIPVSRAFAVRMHGDIIAVGTRSVATIQLFSYASGTLIRSIGSGGSGPGQIGSWVDAMRFTPDGQFIIAAEQSNTRLSMFRVSDGGFVKHIGAGVVANGHKDIEFMPNGELLVADYNNHRICVFSADGDALLRTWGSNGSGDGQFQRPTGLALVGSSLFVLEDGGSRVQVFE